MSQRTEQVAHSIRRVQRFANPAVAGLAAFIFVVLMASAGGYAFERYNRQWHVVLAAGGADGESHRIALSLRDYVHQTHPNVTLEVQQTKGTAANLDLLARGDAHLAMAQADVALDRWVDPAADAGPKGQVVALLYTDKVHLLTCSADEVPPPSHVVFSRMARQAVPLAKVYVPYEDTLAPSGGQVETFLRLATQAGLVPEVDFELVNDDGLPLPTCDESEHGNVAARVRAVGNAGVQRAIEQGWRLAPLSHRGALQRANAALHPCELAAGSYRSRSGPVGAQPEPPAAVPTLEVDRLLLAREDGSVPDWLVQQLAQMLNEQGPALARMGAEDTSEVRQLFLQIQGLNTRERLTSVGVPLHHAAATFYQPGLAWRNQLSENAEMLSLLLTIAGMVVSVMVAMNRGFKWMGKTRLDELVDEATDLMAPHVRHDLGGEPDPESDVVGLRATDMERHLLNDVAQAGNIRVYWLIVSLLDGGRRLERLTQLFVSAGLDFRREEFSEEAFRTFNEAYKAARESIETEIDNLRRAITQYYVAAMLGTLPEDEGPAAQAPPAAILTEAKRVMGVPPVFSRESFRTLTEAYGLVREVREDQRSPR